MSSHYKQTTTGFAAENPVTKNRNEIEKAIHESTWDSDYRRILKFLLDRQWKNDAPPESKHGNDIVRFTLKEIDQLLNCDTKKSRRRIAVLKEREWLLETVVNGQKGGNDFIPVWAKLWGCVPAPEEPSRCVVEGAADEEGSCHEGGTPPIDRRHPSHHELDPPEPSPEIVAMLRVGNHIAREIRRGFDRLIACRDGLGEGSHPKGEGSHPKGEGSHPKGEGSHPKGEGSHPKGEGSSEGGVQRTLPMNEVSKEIINQFLNSLLTSIQTQEDPSPFWEGSHRPMGGVPSGFEWPYAMFKKMRDDPKALNNLWFVQQMFDHATSEGVWGASEEKRILFFATVIEAQRELPKKPGAFVLRMIREQNSMPASSDSIRQATETLAAWDEKLSPRLITACAK
jgi:hypothetical protein